MSNKDGSTVQERLCIFKKRYSKSQVVKNTSRESSITCYYKCPYCLRYHVTTTGKPKDAPETLWAGYSSSGADKVLRWWYRNGVPSGNIYVRKSGETYKVMVK